MVTLRTAGLAAALALGIAGTCWPQEAPPAGAAESKGPTLYGDGAGRLWRWTAGKKDYLTPEGGHLSLGGVGETQLWGWSTEAGQVRLFTLELPKKDPGDRTGGAPASPSPKKPGPPARPVFDQAAFPLADKVDRVGDRTLLVYGAVGGQPRVEIYQGAQPLSLRAWDDGRLVYAAVLGPSGGWLVVGRRADGTPWLEVSGQTVDAPEGWRGRLTVAGWSAAEKDGPAVPLAAGWGAPGGEAPRALFWGPGGWTQPDPTDEPPTAGIYPVVGLPGDPGLSLGGWRADPGTGVLRAWFWDGTAETVAEGSADGQPVALGTGKTGAFLVVRHQSPPWFTLEGAKESTPLEGLGPEDRVVGVEGKVDEKKLADPPPTSSGKP